MNTMRNIIVSKTTIEIDTYAGIEPAGLYTAVYFGDNDDPTESRVSWEEVIESEIEMHTVPRNGPYVYSPRCGSDGVRDLFEIINKLREVADVLESSLDERGILFRDELEDACNGSFDNTRRDEFVFKYEDYIKKLLEQKDD